jgi:hypothetical protein
MKRARKGDLVAGASVFATVIRDMTHVCDYKIHDSCV